MAIDVTHTDPRQSDVKQSSVRPPADSPLDMALVLHEARFAPLQLVVLAFTFLTLVMHRFDIQAIAFAAPALTEVWGIERSSLGPVLAAALLRMAAGPEGRPALRFELAQLLTVKFRARAPACELREGPHCHRSE